MLRHPVCGKSHVLGIDAHDHDVVVVVPDAGGHRAPLQAHAAQEGLADVAGLRDAAR